MNRQDGFIVSLRIDGKRCLVIGTSEEAAVRARMLIDAGAEVRVVGEAPGPAVEALAASHGVFLARRAFDPSDLHDCWLVILADRDPELLASLGPACAKRRLLLCAVDQPGHNSFDHVAIARAGRVSFAVSTAGAAPALAKRLREELERVARDAGLDRFAERIAQLRERTPRTQRGMRLGAAVAGLRLGALLLPKWNEDDAED